MKMQAIDTIKNEDEARQIAIDWQNWQSEQSMSYAEAGEWQAYFTQVADVFELVEEFKENGII